MGEVSTIGLDIAKSVFQVHGVDVAGAVVIRKRISRAKLLEFFATLPTCLVGIEACPTAHYWSRRLQGLGHTVRLMPPSYVKAYVKRGKNDANDAAAICEAVTRPSMRFVATKSEEQQSGLMLHRSRQLLVCQRTMLSNAIRGHMAELGIISAKGRNGTAELLKIIADEQDDRIPAAARFSLNVLARQYAAIREEIVAIERRIHAWHRSSEESRRLEEIPGVGPIVATALMAEVGDWKTFSSGRSFAAWIGLVPRQHSTGGKKTRQDLEAGQSTLALAARCRRHGCHSICTPARHEAALARSSDGPRSLPLRLLTKSHAWPGPKGCAENHWSHGSLARRASGKAVETL
jgi:transposase